MKIAVVGAGAVGGYFGGRLAQAGIPVFFVARGRTLDALELNGLRVESSKGDFHIQEVDCGLSLADAGKIDCILLAVKAWQVTQAAKELKPYVSGSTFIVPLQNGVEASDELLREFEPRSVTAGLCRILSIVIEPGFIRHIGNEPVAVFGELDNSKSERLFALRELLEQAGVRAQIPENIQTAIWEKFMFISSVSGVGAVTRANVGVIRNTPETRRMIEAAMTEVFHLAKAVGVQMQENTVAKSMSFLDNIPAEGTASMQRDIQEGLPSELEYQNGAVVRLAQKMGISAPTHEFLYASLLPAERSARSLR